MFIFLVEAENYLSLFICGCLVPRFQLGIFLILNVNTKWVFFRFLRIGKLYV